MRINCVLQALVPLLFIGILNCFSQESDLSGEKLPAIFEKYNKSSLGENVFAFEPGMDMNEIQILIDTIFARQSERRSEFSKNRYALLFKPGIYELDVKAVRSNTTHGNSVLTNFWRSVENLTVIPTVNSTMVWGVSQAAPLRRVHIKGNLQLFDKGYASGGFLANSKIDGTITSGPQQQWFIRNTEIGKWAGGNWNMMFVGVPGAPEENWPELPYTTINEVPVIREKPFLAFDEKGFCVNIPGIKKNSTGPDWINGVKPEKTLLLDKFYVARPDVDNRVGGPAEGSASSCMVINSRVVCADHIWLWRADHGNGVGWDKNRCANGLIVNGDNVTIYGLFN